MPRIPRKDQKVFGGSLTPTGNIAVFGSNADSAAAYSDDPDVIQNSNWLGGWLEAINGGVNSPALEDFNAVLYVLTRQTAYLLEQGIPEWLIGKKYWTNNWVSYNGVLYKSIADDHSALPTDPTKWASLASTMSGPGICKAWCTFQGDAVVGTPCVINSGFYVHNVLHEATGQYLITMAGAMTNADYVVNAMAGQRMGAGFLAGDDNLISMGKQGKAQHKSTTQFRIFCGRGTDALLEDASMVMVTVFGA